MRVEAIKADIKAKTFIAMNIAGDQLVEVMKRAIDVFYGSYAPKKYIRTDIFRDSPEKGAVVSVGLGAMVDLMDVDKGGHDFYPGSTWDDGRVFETSMHGSHGDCAWTGDTWAITLSMIGAEYKPIVISALAAAGL